MIVNRSGALEVALFSIERGNGLASLLKMGTLLSECFINLDRTVSLIIKPVELGQILVRLDGTRLLLQTILKFGIWPPGACGV